MIVFLCGGFFFISQVPLLFSLPPQSAKSSAVGCGWMCRASHVPVVKQKLGSPFACRQ